MTEIPEPIASTLPLLRFLASKAARGTPASEEDLLQEALLFSLKVFSRWDGRCKFSTFLYANKPYAHLRWKAVSSHAACAFHKGARFTKTGQCIWSQPAFYAAASIHTPIVDDDERTRTLEDLLEQSIFRPPDDTEAERLEQIRESVESLDQRSALVIRLRFGLETGERLTLDQVAAVVGVTRERVRQIESAALRRLRARIER